MRLVPVGPRIPEADIEGGAIHDHDGISMEGYSRMCKKYMAGEYRKLIRRLVDEVGLPQGSRVLEIGPGPGWIGIWLSLERPDLAVTGLELSPDMRRVAEANCREAGVDTVTFVGGDAAQMGFDAGSFDAVVSNGSLHHWLDPTAVFDEIARVLAPDGVFLINDGRRDLGLFGWTIHHVLSTLACFDPTVPGRHMKRGWYTSIRAGYTPKELTTIIDRSALTGWRLDAGLMDLTVLPS